MSKPTLFIGLGGTGTRILSALEKEVGNPAGRAIGMIALDAKLVPDVPLTHVLYPTPPDPINQINELRRNAAEIADWWPAQLQGSASVDYSDGCGMTRAYGRFFLVYHAQWFVRAINDAIGALMRNCPPDVARNSLDVFIASSLTNGTGSGTFMDTAALVRRAAAARDITTVRIFGVQMDALAVSGAGSATQQDVVNSRRAANSIAALLEVDAWSRAAAGREGYSVRVRGEDDGWFDVELPPDTAPIEYNLVIQNLDRRGVERSREQLESALGKALALWAKGIDRSRRTLDTFVAAPPDRRFGSLGASLLTVPGPALADWVEHEAVKQVLEWVVGEGTAEHNARLGLVDQSYAALHPSVDDAARHFFTDVLRIEERPGRERNQLFDRFRTVRDTLETTLDRLNGQLDQASKEELPGYLDDFDRFLKELDRLPDQLNAMARELVQRELIVKTDAQVRGLVEKGALGVAGRFVAGLIQHIDHAWADVAANEAKEADPGKRQDVGVKQAARQQIDEAAANWLVVLRGGFKRASRGNVEAIKTFGAQELDWYFWHAAVPAVNTVYGTLKRHLEAQSRVIAALADQVIRGNAIAKAVSNADDARRAAENVEGGRHVVGAGATFRRWLVAQMQGRGKLDAATNAESVGMRLAEAFGELLAANAHNAKWADALKPVNLERRADSLRLAMTGVVSANLRGAALELCTLDNALREAAKLDLEDWYEGARQSKDARVNRECQSRLMAIYGETTAKAVNDLDWTRDTNAAMVRATDILAAAPVARAFDLAAALWRLEEGKAPGGDTVVAYHPANAATGQAVEALRLAGRLGSAVYVEGDTGFGHGELAILRFELGVALDHVHVPEGFDLNYRRYLPHQTFHPHVDRRYGTRWRVASRWDAGSAGQAACVLLLAQHLGIVAVSRTGIVKCRAELAASDGGHGIASDEVIGPRSLVGCAEWLASHDGARALGLLARACGAELEQRHHRERGWKGLVAGELTKLKADWQKQARAAARGDEERSDVFDSAAQKLGEAMAQALAEGALPSWLHA